MENGGVLRACTKFKTHSALYRCPVCRTGLRFNEPGSFVCQSGHCFDFSRRGYINFISSAPAESYGRELFTHRERIFRDGFYEPVLRAVKQTILNISRGKSSCNILDAGCGQGYYAAELAKDDQLKNCAFFAMDISKDAVFMAAKPGDTVEWMVANVAEMPLKDHSMDILLDILTPANYGEFSRVLKDGGAVVKLVPGAHYLREIRQKIEMQLTHREFSNARVVDYFAENFDLLARKPVTYSLGVTPEQLRSFVQMTPMTRAVDISRADWENVASVTIDVEILVGRKRG